MSSKIPNQEIEIHFKIQYYQFKWNLQFSV